jgi:putative redox protein
MPVVGARSANKVRRIRLDTKKDRAMADTLVPFALQGSGSGVKQTIAIDNSSLSFAAEGHRAFGGTDSAPSPLDYALAALSSCTQVTGQIVAGQNPAAKLGRWDISVKAHLDGAVLLGGGEGVSNFRDVDILIAVDTNLADADFAAFAKEVEHRCPVTQLFRRSGVTVTTRWSAKPLANPANADLRLAS